LCIDIGGGSTEIVSAVGAHAVEVASYSLGTLRLTEAASNLPNRKLRLAYMRSCARDTLEHLPSPTTPHALVTSGAARALIKYACGGAEATLPTRDLAPLTEEIAALPRKERVARFGAARADGIVAGAVVLEAAATRLGLRTIVGTRRGLRDGIVIELMGEAFLTASPTVVAA
jgi:exopolyphosphatase/guanosine-5'-triphosphate,3'-diphosphate pyrophosphatase